LSSGFFILSHESNNYFLYRNLTAPGHKCYLYAEKKDYMRNGQLKPAYNLQISTNKHYSIHPNTTDTKTLESHLQGFKESYHKVPKELVADSGYARKKTITY